MSIRTVLTGRVLPWIVLVLVLGLKLSASSSAEAVLVHMGHSDPAEEEAIRTITAFYGLDLREVDVSSPKILEPAMSELRNPGTLAVLISADVVSQLDRRRMQVALRRSNGSPVPVLVFGVKVGESAEWLKAWSGGAIRDCSSLPADYRPKILQVGNVPALSRTLAGLQLPAVAAPVCRLQFEPSARIQTVLSTSMNDEASGAAVLVRTQASSTEMFFVPRMTSFDTSWIGKRNSLSRAFSSRAQYLLFLSYAAGSYAWHSDGHYANLTIDDPWLTQPYGNLDYKAVLAEMEAHNFHTTVAFIPWNFDRSEPDVVALFRRHPERFSVCLHGNNHTHQEFGDYAKNPLKAQIADIKQGLARMERFQALTGITYDRVMVFPHAAAPGPTFAALRTYGFSGTANLWNVPLDKEFQAGSTFLLRPYTAAYGGLLSLSRYSGNGDVPQAEVAIQAFLGNPVLFYGHESLFAEGAGSFNAHADFINRIQPGTRWTGLGEIARHSHLLRRRLDGGFDVRMLSSEMDLVNPTDQAQEFYIRWSGDRSSPVSSLIVDGRPVAIAPSADGLLFRLAIPAQQVRKLRITYRNDLDLAREDVRKRSLYAYALRTISDFRDLHLSRSSWGRALTQSYYRHHRDDVELYLEEKWWAGVICAGLVFLGIRYHRRRATARMAERPTAR